jgi:uncharacterized protein YbjT (DUF2867 family)
MPTTSPPHYRTAALLGATGLVGGYVLKRLLGEPTYSSVRTLGRRAPEGFSKADYPKVSHHVVDLEQPEAFAELLDVDDVFCCLGTTMAKAGSEAAFRRVDLEIPVEVARVAARQGAPQFVLVSAHGADRGSPFFYNRVKGEAEDLIRSLSFEHVVLARPSLLLGPREEKRLGERVGGIVMRLTRPVMRGPLRNLRPIHARDVAEALVRLAMWGGEGVTVATSEQLQQVAERSRAGASAPSLA